MAGKTIYTFRIPTKLQGISEGGMKDAKTLGFMEMTVDAELQAIARSGNSIVRLASEYAQESLCQIDGKPVSSVEGTKDTAWRQMHPMVRQLCTSAYSKLHNPSASDTEDFLNSQEASAG